MSRPGGTLEAIWIKRARRGPMDSVRAAELVPGRGIVGNADQGRHRQVTILDRARWERVTSDLGQSLDPGRRRANLLIAGIDLQETRERLLTIGECLLRIKGETKPCERMEEVCPGLEEALWPNWGGGAHAEIVSGGTIRIGDIVEWADVQ